MDAKFEEILIVPPHDVDFDSPIELDSLRCKMDETIRLDEEVEDDLRSEHSRLHSDLTDPTAQFQIFCEIDFISDLAFVDSQIVSISISGMSINFCCCMNMNFLCDLSSQLLVHYFGMMKTLLLSVVLKSLMKDVLLPVNHLVRFHFLQIRHCQKLRSRHFLRVA
jgi:hypothetical protein